MATNSNDYYNDLDDLNNLKEENFANNTKIPEAASKKSDEKEKEKRTKRKYESDSDNDDDGNKDNDQNLKEDILQSKKKSRTDDNIKREPKSSEKKEDFSFTNDPSSYFKKKPSENKDKPSSLPKKPSQKTNIYESDNDEDVGRNKKNIKIEKKNIDNDNNNDDSSESSIVFEDIGKKTKNESKSTKESSATATESKKKDDDTTKSRRPATESHFGNGGNDDNTLASKNKEKAKNKTAKSSPQKPASPKRKYETDDEDDNKPDEAQKEHCCENNESFHCKCIPNCVKNCDPDCDCASIERKKPKKAAPIPSSPPSKKPSSPTTQPSEAKTSTKTAEPSVPPQSSTKKTSKHNDDDDDDIDDKKPQKESETKKKQKETSAATEEKQQKTTKTESDKTKTATDDKKKSSDKPNTANGGNGDGGGGGGGGGGKTTANYETDDDESSDNDENFSQAATRQKFIERLNLQNVINNPDDDDKKTKNKHEKVELTTDTIPVMFRGQFVDKKGDLNYGMFADKNKEVEDHPVFKKILKPFMTTEEEEQAMELDTFGFRFEPCMLPSEFDDLNRLRIRAIERLEKEQEAIDESEREQELRNLQNGKKSIGKKTMSDMITKEKIGDVSRSLNYVANIMNNNKMYCTLCRHGNVSTARMAIGPFNDLIENYKKNRIYKDKVELAFDLEEQFEKTIRKEANDTKKEGEEDIPLVTALEIYMHITKHTKDPEEWKYTREEQLAKIMDHLWHNRIFRVAKSKIDTTTSITGRSVMLNSASRYNQIDPASVMVHEGSLRQFRELLKEEKELKKIKPEMLSGYEANGRIKPVGNGSFVNPRHRFKESEKIDTMATWEQVE